MLTRKQHELLLFIDRRLKEGGVSPSFEEMKEALDLKSKSGIHRLINGLEERGFLRRLPNRARALEVLKTPDDIGAGREVRPASPVGTPANDLVEIPFHGKIAAGLPIEALESERTLAVPAGLLSHGDHFALEVSGDSMIDLGILDGDIALVRRQDVARSGEIVVALVEDSEATLKTIRLEGPNVRLEPANSAHRAQVYPAAAIRIQGRLAGIMRRY